MTQPYGQRPVPPVMPGYGPPPKKSGKGCLYAVFGGIAGLFLMGSCVAVLASSSDTPSTPPSTSTTPAAETKNGEKKGAEKKASKKPVTNGIGREYRDGKFAFTVTRVKKGVKKVGNEYVGDTAQGQFVFIYVTVKNNGNKARTFTHQNQTLIDTKGRKFEADPEASLWTDKDSKSFLQQINPGNSVKGILIYDVPRGTRLKAIELHDSMFSGGTTVPLANR